MVIDPDHDGVTHVNVYSRGATRLGRELTNFARMRTPTPDGEFASVEAYWYWLGIDPSNPGREKLRQTHGFRAKELGREMQGADWCDDPKFVAKIQSAIEGKIRANPSLRTELRDSTLPLEHYYVYAGRNGSPPAVVRPSRGHWVLETIKAVRAALKHEAATGAAA